MTSRWATAHGRRFEVETLGVAPAPARKSWEEVLGKAHVSGSTYAVAIVLLYEAWKLKANGHQPVVKLTSTLLKRVSVGSDGKGAALLKLTELRLVSVEQSPGCNPLGTVYFLD